MSPRQVFNFNIFYFAILFLWPVLKFFYLHIDGAGRVEALMTVLAIMVNAKYLFRGPATMKIWYLWVVYSTVNVMVKGFHNDVYPFYLWVIVQLICPLISMILVYNSILYDKEKFLKYIFYFFLIFVLFGGLHMGASDDSYGLENAMGNTYLNNAIFILPFMLLIRGKSKIPLSYVLTIIGVILLIIILSGERKALAGLFIMLVGMVYARNSKKGFKSILAFCVVLAIAYYAGSFIMSKTLAGERFNQQFEFAEYDSFFLTLMGDRAFMYAEGFATFLDNPWTGIGLTNFPYSMVNPLGLMLHTEYMVQLTECGLIGSGLFLTFYIGMIVALIKLYKSGKANYETIILASALLAIIAINFTAWTYSYKYYFMVFGLIYGWHDLYNDISPRIILKK